MLDAWAVRNLDTVDVGCSSCWTLGLFKTRMLQMFAVPAAGRLGCSKPGCCRCSLSRLLDAWVVQNPDAADVRCPGCWTLGLFKTRMLQMFAVPAAGRLGCSRLGCSKPGCCRCSLSRLLDAWVVRNLDIVDVGSCSSWMLRLCETWTL